MKTGTLTITDDAANGSPQVVNLSGEGVVQLPIATVTPASIAFGNQQVGVSSASQDVTLSNTGTGTIAMNITNITVVAVTGTGFARVACL